MKQFLLLMGGVLFTLYGFSQNFTFSVSTGYDQNLNHLDGLRYTNTNELPDFNLSADIGYEITNRFKVRAELAYNNLSFLRDYNSDASDPKNVANTKMVINSMGFSPFVDFRLFSVSRLDIAATAGVNFAFGTSNWQRTFNQAGEKLDGAYFKDEITSGLLGTTGGLILKYNITDNLGIKLSPQYSYYFDSFFTLNDDNFQRMRMNIGVEWKF